VVYEPAGSFCGIVARLWQGAGGNTIDILENPIAPWVRLAMGFPVKFAQKLPIATPGSGKPMFYFGDL
jgi:hypothetical protein